MDDIELEVARLFRNVPGERGDICEFPIIGGHFVKGEDRTRKEQKLACKALRAREWFAVNGPPDAPPLPLSYNGREALKNGDIGHIVALYARSLYALQYDYETHPSFYDYACGVMAKGFNSADKALEQRYPPRPLEGLDGGCYWRLPKQKRGRSI
jgi:hypothetical protein